MNNPVQSTVSQEMRLGDIDFGIGGGTKFQFNAFIGNNLGHRTFTTCIAMKQFYENSLIANDRTNMNPQEIAQRPLDPIHAKKLGIYILKGLVSAVIDHTKQHLEKGKTSDVEKIPQSWLDIQNELGQQVYEGLQPIVVNIRECSPNGDDLKVSADPNHNFYKVQLEQKHKFWVVDGQHRRRGMELVIEFLQAICQRACYARKEIFVPKNRTSLRITQEELLLWEKCLNFAAQNVTVTLEVHLGLDPSQERQLFHDMNRLVKKMDTNLALDFDTSNPVNGFTKTFLVDELGFNISDSDIKDWDNDSGSLARKEVTSVNARLFMNKTNINGATAEICNVGENVAKSFWTAVSKIPGFGQEGAHKNTVAAQSVILKALAKLAYDFMLSSRKPENGEELFNLLLQGIDQTGQRKIDFNHSNPVWRYYELTSDEIKSYHLESLKDFLPDASTGNRDIGSYQSNYIRFGSKHNDIFPILGDMIRWQLGLPSRKK